MHAYPLYGQAQPYPPIGHPPTNGLNYVTPARSTSRRHNAQRESERYKLERELAPFCAPVHGEAIILPNRSICRGRAADLFWKTEPRAFFLPQLRSFSRSLSLSLPRGGKDSDCPLLRRDALLFIAYFAFFFLRRRHRGPPPPPPLVESEFGSFSAINFIGRARTFYFNWER